MLRKIGLVLIVLVAAIAGAGAYFRAQGAALPGLPLPQIPGRVTGVIASRDSVAMADLATSRCRLLVGKPQRTCYEDFLLDQIGRASCRERV